MHDLIKRYPIVSDQIDARELSVILRELQKTLNLNVSGDIVELGCYVGTTALFMQRLLVEQKSDKRLYVYDSFEGLPPKTAADASPAGEQFRAGALRATKADLIKHFKQAGLPLPTIHKGWFADIMPGQLPDMISFAFLDGDFYESIRQSLQLIWPRLAPGALVVVDDYQSQALPGARRAVEAWLKTHLAAVTSEASLAIIRRSA